MGARIAPIRRAEGGMTIIEVVIAAMILAIGLLGTFKAFDSSRSLSTVSETKQAGTRYAEQQLEAMRAMGWANLQIDPSSLPGGFSDTRGTLDATNKTYAPPQSSSGVASGTESLSLAASSSGCTSSTCVTAGATSWSSGNVSGTIYRFVTTGADTTCGTACSSAGSTDHKRLTVALMLTGAHAPKAAVVLSTVVVNPAAAPSSATANSNPVQSSGGSSIGAATGTTYYLSDTPVGTTYSAPSSDHATNNTTLNNSGVPDQLRLSTPSAPSSATHAHLAYTYSTDVPPGSYGGLGVTASTNCASTTKLTSHLWATPVLSSTSSVTATGNAALSIPSMTLNGVTTGGTLCATVYDLALNGSNAVTSATALGTYTYHLPSWPTAPELLTTPFRFLTSGSTRTIAPGHRLGFMLTVDSADSSGLTFLYDHPDWPASVQLETQ